ncbi:MAG: esterase family protein [Chthoniobacteraceae bacterium]
MRISYHRHESRHLGRAMEYKVYGSRGRPLVVFPTSNGRFFQFEDSGMIDALGGFIQAGLVQIWTVDSLDWESYFAEHGDFAGRIERHEAYFRYVREEFLPELTRGAAEANGGTAPLPLFTGCSMGAFHAANFLFRFPWLGAGAIALSGVYSTRYFFGNALEGAIYYNSPLHYLRGLEDHAILEQLRRLKLIFCCGQGAWEDEMLEETRQLDGLLRAKSIPAWVDYWGHDVNHDWPWWRQQIVYFLEKWLAA